MFNDNTREFKIIEAFNKGTLVGKFVDMHTARRILGPLADEVSYNFTTIVNEKRDNELFWNIIRNGYVLRENQIKR